MKKRTEITVETHQVTVIHRPRPTPDVWCPGCAEVVKTVSDQEAAAMAGLSLRTIYRHLEAGRFHFTELPGGRLLICLNSLLEAIREGRSEGPAVARWPWLHVP